MDGDIDFGEFVSYCLENEKQLRIIFNDIDINDDEKIDTNELISAFQRIGVNVDEQEVLRLVKRIKTETETSAELNFEEFRDYLLLHPTDSLHDLMKSWRRGTVGFNYFCFFSWIIFSVCVCVEFWLPINVLIKLTLLLI